MGQRIGMRTGSLSHLYEEEGGHGISHSAPINNPISTIVERILENARSESVSGRRAQCQMIPGAIRTRVHLSEESRGSNLQCESTRLPADSRTNCISGEHIVGRTLSFAGQYIRVSHASCPFSVIRKDECDIAE